MTDNEYYVNREWANKGTDLQYFASPSSLDNAMGSPFNGCPKIALLSWPDPKTSRYKQLVQATRVCFWVVYKTNISYVELSRRLSATQPAVSMAIDRDRKLAAGMGIEPSEIIMPKTLPISVSRISVFAWIPVWLPEISILPLKSVTADLKTVVKIACR